MKQRACTKRDFGELDFESWKSETVELQSVSEMETSILHCMRGGGKHLQTTAAKRAAHTSVVKKDIHYW